MGSKISAKTGKADKTSKLNSKNAAKAGKKSSLTYVVVGVAVLVGGFLAYRYLGQAGGQGGQVRAAPAPAMRF